MDVQCWGLYHHWSVPGNLYAGKLCRAIGLRKIGARLIRKAVTDPHGCRIVEPWKNYETRRKEVAAAREQFGIPEGV